MPIQIGLQCYRKRHTTTCNINHNQHQTARCYKDTEILLTDMLLHINDCMIWEDALPSKLFRFQRSWYYFAQALYCLMCSLSNWYRLDSENCQVKLHHNFTEWLQRVVHQFHDMYALLICCWLVTEYLHGNFFIFMAFIHEHIVYCYPRWYRSILVSCYVV